MARCAVVGPSEKARITANLLEEECVHTMIVDEKNHKQIIKVCTREHGLEVVVVFYSEIEGDGLDFLQELRESMPFVHIHVLKKGLDAKSTNKKLMKIPVDGIFSSSSSPHIIAKSITKRWFNSAAKDSKAPKVVLGLLDKAMFGWPERIIKKEEELAS